MGVSELLESTATLDVEDKVGDDEAMVELLEDSAILLLLVGWKEENDKVGVIEINGDKLGQGKVTVPSITLVRLVMIVIPL